MNETGTRPHHTRRFPPPWSVEELANAPRGNMRAIVGCGVGNRLALHTHRGGPMTDEWWWAQFGHRHGPISLSELKEKFQGVNLHEIFVWRAGFHEWREAGTVPELDIVEPPPIPEQPPKPRIGVLKKLWYGRYSFGGDFLGVLCVGFVLGFVCLCGNHQDFGRLYAGPSRRMDRCMLLFFRRKRWGLD